MATAAFTSGHDKSENIDAASATNALVCTAAGSESVDLNPTHWVGGMNKANRPLDTLARQGAISMDMAHLRQSCHEWRRCDSDKSNWRCREREFNF